MRGDNVVVKEASYSRIYQHTQDDSTFAIIGSSEAVKDDDGNVIDYKNRKLDLHKYVRNYCQKHPGCGYNEINGTYTYDDGSVGSEYSLIIYNIAKSDAIAMGKKLGQECILWKDDNFMGYIYMDGRESDVTFSNSKGKNMNFTNADKVGYGSRLPKDKNTKYGFTFEGVIMYPSLKGNPTYESFKLVTESKKYNGYTIKYNKDSQQYEVIIDGIVDAEFDTENQCIEWIDGKTDKNMAEDIATTIGTKAKKLTQNQVDRYLSWDECKNCDTDNIYVARFKSKKQRISAIASLKRKGYKIVSQTDDDYNDTKLPYWVFISKSI